MFKDILLIITDALIQHPPLQILKKISAPLTISTFEPIVIILGSNVCNLIANTVSIILSTKLSRGSNQCETLEILVSYRNLVVYMS